MKPGARVRAVLDVENRANAFAIPRQAIFEKEGKKLVYRKRRRDSFEPVRGRDRLVDAPAASS